MKTLIYSNTGLTSKQIGLTAEIAEKVKTETNEIKVVLCNNVLDNCYFNRTHNVLGCAACQSRLTKVLSFAGIESSDYLFLEKYPEPYALALPSFDSLEQLMDFTYDGINIGRGVASSIISYKRDYHITSAKYGTLIDIELRKSMNVLLNFKKIIADFKPDIIYLFNGRFSEVYPLVELARKMSIRFYAMESGSGNNYELFLNHLPHSIKLRNQHINEFWEQSPPSKREKLAISWFEHKRKGSESFDKSFTSEQTKDLLPGNFNPALQNILLLNSSEDELKAIIEWQSMLYTHQNEAINQIIKHFEKNKGIQFYLRIHPNLGEVDNIQIKEISQMKSPNLTVIAAESAIDTYAMISACDKVVTFGSSTGIEATFWGKPSILYGKSFYMEQGCVYTPQSFDELVHLINDNNLTPKPKEKTYKYGLYMSSYGKQTTHFKFSGLNNSTYKNHKIRRIYPSILKYLVSYLPNLKLWFKLNKAYFERSFHLSDIFKYK